MSRLRMLLIAVLAMAAAAPLAAQPAGAAPVVVQYEEGQVGDLVSGASYLGLSDEELHVTAAGVHHFLLGVAGKLASPTGGCSLNLGAAVDASFGPWFVDVDFGDSPSNDLVAQYYCLSPAQAAKVNVTLLIFLAGVDASQNGVSYPDISPAARTSLTLPGLLTTTFQPDFTVIAEGDWVMTTFIDEGRLHLLIANLSGLAVDCLDFAFFDAFGELGAGPIAIGQVAVRGDCVAVPGVEQWSVVGIGESLLVVDTGVAPGLPLDIAGWEQLPDGSPGIGFAAVEIPAGHNVLDPNVHFLSMAGSTDLLRRSGPTWVPVQGAATSPGFCGEFDTRVCFLDGRFALAATSVPDSQVAAGEIRAHGTLFAFTPLGVRADPVFLASLIDSCSVTGEFVLAVDLLAVDPLFTLGFIDSSPSHGSSLSWDELDGGADLTVPCAGPEVGRGPIRLVN